jgi:hypothetical protein
MVSTAAVERDGDSSDVSEHGIARGGRSNEIALDQGAGKTDELDAVVVSGDQVPVRGSGPPIVRFVPTGR